MKNPHFHCPVNGWDCPYYRKEALVGLDSESGICTLDDPYHDCDDFYASWEGYEAEDYTDYSNCE